jgi:hypothetical protein
MELSVSERLRDRVSSGNTSAGDLPGDACRRRDLRCVHLLGRRQSHGRNGLKLVDAEEVCFEGCASELEQVAMVGEDHHLRRVRKLGQDAKRRGSATIVEVDEEVVGDNLHCRPRHWVLDDTVGSGPRAECPNRWRLPSSRPRRPPGARRRERGRAGRTHRAAPPGVEVGLERVLSTDCSRRLRRNVRGHLSAASDGRWIDVSTTA